MAGCEGTKTARAVDLQAVVFDVCERDCGGCACKITRTNLARPDQPLSARCEQRYDIALTVLLAIVKAGGDAAAVEAAEKLASAPDLKAENADLRAALVPFAAFAKVGLYGPDDRGIVSNEGAGTVMKHLTVGDFKAALAALDRAAPAGETGGRDA